MTARHSQIRSDAKRDLRTFDSGRYQEALRLQEELTAHVETAEKERAGKLGRGDGLRVGQRELESILAREFTKALAAAERALSIDPGLLWVGRTGRMRSCSWDN